MCFMGRIQDLEQQISALKQELAAARAERQPDPILEDYEFQTLDGARRLSELFGDHPDLILVHNMGGGCNYCTLWADGYSGYLRHINTRASFVVVSPDTPEQQRRLAEARGWGFTMAQDADRRFTTEMGYYREDEGGWWPGVSVFHRDADGTITRTGEAGLGPGDDFCMVWPLFEMCPGGVGDWEPH